MSHQSSLTTDVSSHCIKPYKQLRRLVNIHTNSSKCTAPARAQSIKWIKSSVWSHYSFILIHSLSLICHQAAWINRPTHTYNSNSNRTPSILDAEAVGVEPNHNANGLDSNSNPSISQLSGSSHTWNMYGWIQHSTISLFNLNWFIGYLDGWPYVWWDEVYVCQRNWFMAVNCIVIDKFSIPFIPVFVSHRTCNL